MCLDIFYNRKVYKLSGVARRRKGAQFFSEKWKAKWKKGRSKNEAALVRMISYYWGGGAQCMMHTFELLCKRNLWKGGLGVILGSILTQRRCDRSLDGGGGNLRLSDHESNVLHGGFCFCVCMEIVFALSQAGNKYFVPTNSVGPIPLGI